jgi:hypothetical protein
MRIGVLLSQVPIRPLSPVENWTGRKVEAADTVR